MKILLIHPRLERSFFSDIKLPPLGLASIAGVLREAGHDVRIFDGILSGNQIRDIKDRLADNPPEIVGIGATSALAEIALQIAALIKSREPKTAVVMGGVHPTLFPLQMISNPQIDYVVRGEGELSMAELAKALESEREPAGIAGVVYKTKGEIVENGPRKPVDNLDDLPMPAYDLLPIRRYTSLQIAERPFASMITSRGCPYTCVFCSARLTMGPKYRAFSPERTVEEIQWLIRTFGVKEVLFKDSEFTMDLARVESICDLLGRKGIKIKWSCNGRIGRLSRDLLRTMRGAGCRLIEYGIESGDEDILVALSKQITIEEVRATFAMTRQAGLKTIANFMIGNPGETRASIDKTLRLAKEIKPDYCDFSFLTPFPGTELYERAERNGWLLAGFNPSNIRLDRCTMNATQMSGDELKGMFKKAYRSFYLRPGFILGRIFRLNRFEWKMNAIGFLKILGLV